MTSGASATNSAAYLRMSSASPAAQRVSIRTLRPSVQPNCCSPCRNAAMRACLPDRPRPRVMSTPMRRIRSGCCARAASGHAAAAPPSTRDELAPPHVRLRGSGRGHRIGSSRDAGRADRCPLWVKSRHVHRNRACPLYSQKRPRKRIPAKAMSALPPKAEIHAGPSARSWRSRRVRAYDKMRRVCGAAHTVYRAAREILVASF